MANVPPVAESGWAFSTSQTIDASVEKVWNVLLDFPAYPEWNPFVRKQIVKDKSDRVLESQTAEVGVILDMTTHIPPTSSARPSSTRVTVTHVDHEDHRVAWRFSAWPSWVLHSLRWQSVTVTEDGKAKYESIEVFNGLLAPVVMWFIGKDLQKSFEAMGEGLKRRSEQT